MLCVGPREYRWSESRWARKCSSVFNEQRHPPQVDDNPVFDDAVGNLESHLALSPLLFFRVAATAELPARQSFALGAHELLARKAGLHELSVATTTRHQRLSTTTTHDLKLANSFTMVIPTARAILDIGGSADGWI